MCQSGFSLVNFWTRAIENNGPLVADLESLANFEVEGDDADAMNPVAEFVPGQHSVQPLLLLTLLPRTLGHGFGLASYAGVATMWWALVGLRVAASGS